MRRAVLCQRKTTRMTQPKNNHVRDTLNKVLAQSRDLSLFQPQEAHRRAKSNFWTTISTQELGEAGYPQDLATALQFGADPRIEQWMGLPGFRDWFYNRDELKQKVDSLLHKSLDEIQAILGSGILPAGVKLDAIKVVLQMHSRILDSEEEAEGPTADEKISRMDRTQLEDYIRKSLRMLPDTPTDS